MDFGVAVPTIDSSVSMRILSSFKETRRSGEKIFSKPKSITGNIEVNDIENALIYGFTMCYAQGLSQLKLLKKKYDLNYEEICKIWRGLYY